MNSKQLRGYIEGIAKENNPSIHSAIALLRQEWCLIDDLEKELSLSETLHRITYDTVKQLTKENQELKENIKFLLEGFNSSGWTIKQKDCVPIGQMWINSNYDI